MPILLPELYCLEEAIHEQKVQGLCFEIELAKAKEALGKVRGKKIYEKVIESVGRIIGKYSSIAKY